MEFIITLLIFIIILQYFGIEIFYKKENKKVNITKETNNVINKIKKWFNENL